jgi:hypothetical protein
MIKTHRTAIPGRLVELGVNSLGLLVPLFSALCTSAENFQCADGRACHLARRILGSRFFFLKSGTRRARPSKSGSLRPSAEGQQASSESPSWPRGTQAALSATPGAPALRAASGTTWGSTAPQPPEAA